MHQIGIFVGEHGKWAFLHDIYADISARYKTVIFKETAYKTPLFSGRINRWATERLMRTILRESNVSFFDWASELLVPASHLPKTGAIITRLHSYELYVWAPKVNWDHVDKVILVSQHMHRKFIELYPNHAHKAEVVDNGVVLDKFTPPAQRDFKLRLGMLCNIHPVKRIYETILSIYGLKQQGYQPHLTIAGGRWADGYFDDYLVSIQRLIEKLGLQNDVALVGFVKDTAAWLQTIDLFISNSYWEGQQVALVEAMAAGCYCLAHNCDGAEEVVPAEQLFLTDAELQQKVIEYANLPVAIKQQRHDQMRAIACSKFDAEDQKAAIRRIFVEVAQTYHKKTSPVHQPHLIREAEGR